MGANSLDFEIHEMPSSEVQLFMVGGGDDQAISLTRLNIEVMHFLVLFYADCVNRLKLVRSLSLRRNVAPREMRQDQLSKDFPSFPRHTSLL